MRVLKLSRGPWKRLTLYTKEQISALKTKIDEREGREVREVREISSPQHEDETEGLTGSPTRVEEGFWQDTFDCFVRLLQSAVSSQSSERFTIRPAAEQ